MNEIAAFFDVNQLQPHKTQDACGFFSVALCFAANENGLPFKHDTSWVIQSAFTWYAEYNGNFDISNTRGMELWQLYKLITEKGGHYQAIDANATAIAS